MGFIVMVLSAIIGVFLIIMGGIRIKNKQGGLGNAISLLIGIVLVFFAIWLGFPK